MKLIGSLVWACIGATFSSLSGFVGLCVGSFIQDSFNTWGGTELRILIVLGAIGGVLGLLVGSEIE